MAETTATARVGEGGAAFLIEVTAASGKEEDVSALTQVLDFDDLAESITQVAGAMTDALRRVQPHEAEVTFGVDAAVETGKLTSMLVKGAGKATFEVRLLWRSDPADSSP